MSRRITWRGGFTSNELGRLDGINEQCGAVTKLELDNGAMPLATSGLAESLQPAKRHRELTHSVGVGVLPVVMPADIGGELFLALTPVVVAIKQPPYLIDCEGFLVLHLIDAIWVVHQSYALKVFIPIMLL